MATSKMSDYENLKFNPFSPNSILLDNLSNPDLNFFSGEHFTNLETNYFSPEEAKIHFKTKEQHFLYYILTYGA